MAVEYTAFARAQMGAEGVAAVKIEAVLDAPDSIEVGDVYVRYEGSLGGRTLVLFVLAGSDPPRLAYLAME